VHEVVHGVEVRECVDERLFIENISLDGLYARALGDMIESTGSASNARDSVAAVEELRYQPPANVAGCTDNTDSHEFRSP
jgi:hypothetical protein